MQLPPALHQFFAFLGRFILPDARKQAAQVYPQLVEQARDPWFYETAGVPDSLDGRFELLLLHLFLFLRRFNEDTTNINYQPFKQALIEMMIDDMDRSLREMGVGDAGVVRRIKAMGAALMGRLNAYETALEDRDAVTLALKRNVYATVEPKDEEVYQLQIYAGYQLDHFRVQKTARMANGVIEFLNPGEIVREAVRQEGLR